MDGTVDELLVLAAKQVNGRQKRIFIAAVCEKLCDGNDHCRLGKRTHLYLYLMRNFLACAQ